MRKTCSLARKWNYTDKLLHCIKIRILHVRVSFRFLHFIEPFFFHLHAPYTFTSLVCCDESLLVSSEGAESSEVTSSNLSSGSLFRAGRVDWLLAGCGGDGWPQRLVPSEFSEIMGGDSCKKKKVSVAMEVCGGVCTCIRSRTLRVIFVSWRSAILRDSRRHAIFIWTGIRISNDLFHCGTCWLKQNETMVESFS